MLSLLSDSYVALTSAIALFVIAAGIVLVPTAIFLWVTLWRRCSLFVLGCAFVLCSAVGINGLMAPPRVWPVMLAAYNTSQVQARPDLRRELDGAWVGMRGHLSVLGWAYVSAKWGFCHEMWPQVGCIVAPGERMPQGIAREELQLVANRA